MNIGLLAAALAGTLLLRFGLVAGRRRNLARVLARGLERSVGQLAVHVVNAGNLDAAPQSLELGLDGVVQRGVVEPDVAGKVFAVGAGDEDLVLGLEAGERVLAVGPAVLEVADGEARGVRLALQKGEQARGVGHAGDHGPVAVRAGLPRLLAQARVGPPLDAGVAAQALGQLLLVLVAGVADAQVVDDVLHRLGRAAGLEKIDGKLHVRLDVDAVARQLRLRVHLRVRFPLALGRRRRRRAVRGRRRRRRWRRKRRGLDAHRVRELGRCRRERALEGG